MNSRFGLLDIEETDDGVRVLVVGKDRIPQSAVMPGDPSYLHFEYVRLSITALALVPDAKRFLVLGVGGGTMPRFLRWLRPESEVDGVELDPAVLQFARDRLEFTDDPRIRVHVGDAREFLESSASRWDVIFLDAYAADVVPPHLSTFEFFSLVADHLSFGGTAVVNVWGPPNPRFGSVRRTVREVFPAVVDLAGEADRNHVLFGLCEEAPYSRDSVVRHASERLGAHPLPFDLPGLIGRDWAGMVPASTPGRVLHDEPPRPPLLRARRR